MWIFSQCSMGLRDRCRSFEPISQRREVGRQSDQGDHWVMIQSINIFIYVFLNYLRINCEEKGRNLSFPMKPRSGVEMMAWIDGGRRGVDKCDVVVGECNWFLCEFVYRGRKILNMLSKDLGNKRPPVGVLW